MKKNLSSRIEIKTLTSKPGLYIVKVNRKVDKTLKDLMKSISNPPRVEIIKEKAIRLRSE